MANEKRLIDREKLLDKLTWLAKNEDQFRQSVICGVMHTIAVAPAVEAVEVVHSYALLAEQPNHVVLTHKCRKCNALLLSTDNYCSMCGAKMDGGGDNGSKQQG